MKREETAEFLSERTWVVAFFVASGRIRCSFFSVNRDKLTLTHFSKMNEAGFIIRARKASYLSDGILSIIESL